MTERLSFSNLAPTSQTTRPRSVFRVWALLTLVASAVWITSPTQAFLKSLLSGGAESPALSETNQSHLPLAETVENSNLEATDRQRAAAEWLTIQTPESLARMVEDLRQGDAAVRQAILHAIAASPAPPPPGLAEPLVEMLSTVTPTQTEDLGVALGRFLDVKLTARLIKLAEDQAAPSDQRRAAIAALGYQPTRAAVQSLVGLLDDASPQVRSAALGALEQLSGIVSFGPDPDRWRLWWQQNSSLSDTQWTMLLSGSLSGRVKDLRQNRDVLRQRLIDLNRQVYLGLDLPERETMLSAMLADPLGEIRALGMDLVGQRMLDMGADGITPALRADLLRRLDDPQPQIQRRAVLLLRDLADPDGAVAVAERLGVERWRQSPPSVIQAYLLIMARVPRAAVVRPAMDLLSDATLGPDAARALSAAADAGLLSPDELTTAADGAREQVNRTDRPEPAYIQLLGRTGTEEDWARIEKLLDHPDDNVREAAARTWALYGRPLEPLAARAGDAIIQPIFYSEAGRRGNNAEIFLTLVDHPPSKSSLADAWVDALTRVAARVMPDLVLTANHRLEVAGQPPELREKLLTASIAAYLGDGRTTAVLPPDAAIATHGSSLGFDLANLLLTRAKLRLAAGNFDAARGDYLRITGLGQTLPEDSLEQIEDGLIITNLQLAAPDAAAQQARAAIDRWKDSDVLGDRRELLVKLFVDDIARRRRSNDMAAAGATLQALEPLLDDNISDDLRRTIADLRTQISPPPPASSPTTQPAQTLP
ncbi:MAG: HEAT repeat domain-containing protein [Phycisphaeraceae bacterium]|nr:HEAT repeat domain-containing protein [Phycisphaeraceae bacterium]